MKGTLAPRISNGALVRKTVLFCFFTRWLGIVRSRILVRELALFICLVFGWKSAGLESQARVRELSFFVRLVFGWELFDLGNEALIRRLSVFICLVFGRKFFDLGDRALIRKLSFFVVFRRRLFGLENEALFRKLVFLFLFFWLEIVFSYLLSTSIPFFRIQFYILTIIVLSPAIPSSN